MFQDLNSQANYIKENFTKIDKIEPINHQNLIIYSSPENIIEFLKYLRDDKNLAFKTLLDVFGADMLGIRSPRFEIIYNLLSYKLFLKNFIKKKEKRNFKFS